MRSVFSVDVSSLSSILFFSVKNSVWKNKQKEISNNTDNTILNRVQWKLLWESHLPKHKKKKKTIVKNARRSAEWTVQIAHDLTLKLAQGVIKNVVLGRHFSNQN